MLKKNLKTLIITSVVILLPILAGLYLWDKLPEQMPIHFGENGEPDNWAPKEFAVLGLPVILVALQWILTGYMGQDPKRKNISEKIRKIYDAYGQEPGISLHINLGVLEEECRALLTRFFEKKR